MWRSHGHASLRSRHRHGGRSAHGRFGVLPLLARLVVGRPVRRRCDGHGGRGGPVPGRLLALAPRPRALAPAPLRSARHGPIARSTAPRRLGRPDDDTADRPPPPRRRPAGHRPAPQRHQLGRQDARGLRRGRLRQRADEPAAPAGPLPRRARRAGARTGSSTSTRTTTPSGAAPSSRRWRLRYQFRRGAAAEPVGLRPGPHGQVRHAPSRLGRLRGRRAMLDDPFAIFSTGWLVQQMGVEAVVLVRDPVSFVGSWRALNWTIHFHELLEQPALVRDHLGPYVDRMRALVGSPDWLARTCLLWEATYDVVDRAFRQLPGVHLVGYESLVQDPMGGFADLYGRFGLTWSDDAAGRVREATTEKAGRGAGLAPLVAARRALPHGLPPDGRGDGAVDLPDAADRRPRSTGCASSPPTWPRGSCPQRSRTRRSAAARCGGGSRRRPSSTTRERRVLADVAAEQPARLADQPEEPLEAERRASSAAPAAGRRPRTGSAAPQPSHQVLRAALGELGDDALLLREAQAHEDDVGSGRDDRRRGTWPAPASSQLEAAAAASRCRRSSARGRPCAAPRPHARARRARRPAGRPSGRPRRRRHSATTAGRRR